LIYIILLNIAIFQGIVLGIIILKSPLFRSTANKYLAFSIFTLSLLLLNLVFEIAELYDTLPLLRFIDDVEWAFIFPVFIFLFVANQINHPINQSKRIGWLFIPFLYSAILNIFNDFDVIAGIYDIPNSFDTTREVLYFIHNILLPPLFIVGISIFTYTIIKYSNNTQEKKWISIIWILVSILLLSWVFAILIGQFFNYDISSFMKLLALYGTFLIHWTAYFGVFKFKLAKDREGINALLTSNVSSDYKEMALGTKKVYQTSNLELSTKDNPHFKNLEILFQKHQIYRDSTLNREKVSEKLGISAGYLSQLVNNITGENFSSYINYYRVEAVKKMMSDSEFKNYSLLALGFESGFTSKTTFYSAFKKTTRMTPSAYRNANK